MCRALPKTAEGRLRLALVVVAAVALASFFSHNVYSCLNADTSKRFDCPTIIGTAGHVGIDFDWGIYGPASLVLAGKGPYVTGNPYPPLVSVLGLPFAFLPFDTAYKVYLVGLALGNLAALWLVLDLAAAVFANVWPNAGVQRWLVWSLGAILSFFHFGSYPFIFSIERGNCDAFPQLFSVMALWLMVKRPRMVWLPVILISMAVHVKIYPAILFALVFWRFRWRSILPLLVANAGFLLVLGWKTYQDFRNLLRVLVAGDASWVGNHSALSFYNSVLVPHGYQSLSAKMLVLVVVGIWALGGWVLWRRGFSAANALRLYALSVPVMCVVPGVSHDYKLVILLTPIAVMLLSSMAKLAASQSWKPLLVLLGSLFAAYWLSGAHVLVTSKWLGNKFPFVLLLELMALVDILISGAELPPRIKGALEAYLRWDHLVGVRLKTGRGRPYPV